MTQSLENQRLMNEAEVKKLLGIDDWRHLTKQGVIEFISAIPQMDPEVAMKALEQFPELANMALGIAKEEKASLEAALQANNQSTEAALSVINTVIEVLEKELQKDELTAEERSQILDRLMALANLTAQVKKEDRLFYERLAYAGMIFGAVLVGGVAVCLSGGRIKLEDLGKAGKSIASSV